MKRKRATSYPRLSSSCLVAVSYTHLIAYGYGLTETTATVSYCHLDGFEFGSIGRPLGGVEVKIDEQAGGGPVDDGDAFH